MSPYERRGFATRGHVDTGALPRSTTTTPEMAFLSDLTHAQIA